MEKIVTRIAPSPTGHMHIGTARTALFNWLYARKKGGKFLLRIEDTDKERSSPEATKAIFSAMEWLGLDFDGDPIHQADRAQRHKNVANQLLEQRKAFKCFATQSEIAKYRKTALKNGHTTLFRSPWRDAAESTYPDKPFVIRIRAPRKGKTVVHDKVQGDVLIRNEQLDDMVLLRSDGTPVYMLSAVVDDHDMGVTHVIRGDDHLNNAARQMLIYEAMKWPLPTYAHIPLIYGEDGKKLSKRHGAIGIGDYQKMGYPASGMRNYLARLGCGYGDAEFFSDLDAQTWFDLDNIGKSPARFDMKKLQNLCGQHIANTGDTELLGELVEYCASAGEDFSTKETQTILLTALYCAKDRSKTYQELIEKLHFCITKRPVSLDQETSEFLKENAFKMIATLTPQLQSASWSRESLEAVCKTVADNFGANFRKLAGPIRAALAGKIVTPSVFDMMLVLGREETIARLVDLEKRATE